MTLTAPTSQAEGAIDLLMDAQRRWDDALRIAELLAVDPHGLGGARVRAGPGPARERWLRCCRELTPDADYRTVPGAADQEVFSGGLDLIATLTEGKSVYLPGQLSKGGTLVIRMAEQIVPAAAQAVATRLDEGGDDFLLLLLDEGEEGAGPLRALSDRLAFELRLDGIPMAFLEDSETGPGDIAKARRRLEKTMISDRLINILGKACFGCGVLSLRVQQFGVRTALAAAALADRPEVTEEDVAEAARLILPSRVVPQEEEEEAPSPREKEPSDTAPEGHEEPPTSDAEEPTEAPHEEDLSGDDALAETILEAVKSGAVSLSTTTLGSASPKNRMRSNGRTGAVARSRRDGRPVGTAPGDPRRGDRLDVLATLRAAAPWQKLRPPPASQMLIRIYPSDFRVTRYAHKAGSSVIFVVDASGSSAMQRLAEAKGAVEALLAECYSRRDRVGLVAFRGEAAEEVVPPTRSLTRARRAMAGLPGGGGTPLASAMERAFAAALAERQEGRRPLIVFLSDGRGNIDLSGAPDRAAAQRDAESMAALFAEQALDILFFDTSKRPSDRVQALAGAMNARYLPLPYANGELVSSAVGEERRKLMAKSG